jgi:hypothetical protein
MPPKQHSINNDSEPEQTAISWYATAWSNVYEYQNFEGRRCFQLQDRSVQDQDSVGLHEQTARKVGTQTHYIHHVDASVCLPGIFNIHVVRQEVQAVQDWK